MEKEKHLIKGKVTKKLPSSSDNPKAPAGKVYFGEEAFTCWDKAQFEQIQLGDKLELEYYETTSSFGGQEYINKNIIGINYVMPGEEVPEPLPKVFSSKSPKETIHSMNGIINIDGRHFRVASIELEEVSEDGRTKSKN
jgi:hypothetical protein